MDVYEMKIGSVELDNRVILAPLAGITHLPFRLLAKEAGCALVYSEMISSNGLVQNSKKTRWFTKSIDKEKPLSVQIFGAEPFIMADAAQIVASTGADIIDINCGCSVKKVIKNGAGAALMRNLQNAEAVFFAVKRSVNIPVTIKIRSGWDKSGRQALQLAEIAEKCGVDAIAVHPRTALQGFKGKADWSIIGKIKKKVSIPVIGNGDIGTPQDAVRMLEETGCDGLMIGRAAIGNPSIITRVIALMQGDDLPDMDIARHFNIMIKYTKACVKHFGEKRACRMMRSRLCWFVKGLPDSGRFRRAINRVSSEDEALELVASYKDLLTG